MNGYLYDFVWTGILSAVLMSCMIWFVKVSFLFGWCKMFLNLINRLFIAFFSSVVGSNKWKVVCEDNTSSILKHSYASSLYELAKGFKKFSFNCNKFGWEVGLENSIMVVSFSIFNSELGMLTELWVRSGIRISQSSVEVYAGISIFCELNSCL